MQKRTGRLTSTEDLREGEDAGSKRGDGLEEREGGERVSVASI